MQRRCGPENIHCGCGRGASTCRFRPGLNLKNLDDEPVKQQLLVREQRTQRSKKEKQLLKKKRKRK